MRVHILGICGTFMGSLAQLAKALGHQVSGSDHGVYPPMSEQLSAAGIDLIEGFDPAAIPADTELVIIGNAMSQVPMAKHQQPVCWPGYLSAREWHRVF